MQTRSSTSGGDAHGARTAVELDEEQPSRRLSGRLDLMVRAWCILVALFVLRQVFFPLSQGSQVYLVIFLAATLPLTFVCYRAGTRTPSGRGGPDGDADRADHPSVLDWLLSGLTVLVGLYPVLPVPLSGLGFGGYSAFLDRQGSLATMDVAAGLVLTVLVLEAARRTTGWILPTVCVAFFAYGYYGGFLPVGWSISHIGLSIEQIVNALYNEASGFFGVPLDVAATYIVLFTIYGAVLERMGAGRFFVEFAFALFRRSRTAPGRTVATSGFLLGTVSGSGTATAVTLGSFAWPILKKAGYPREAAGGMIAASGIGAILSPPTLGAAAFIIAEYLSVSYLEVLGWALVPTLLYYLGIFVAVEIDARRFGARRVDLAVGSPLRLLVRSGYHFLSLGVIVFFLVIEVPPFRTVVYATAVAALFGLLEAVLSRRPVVNGFDDTGTGEAEGWAAGDPLPLRASLRGYVVGVADALASGIRSAVPVIAVCAAAGVITSIIAKTGLGQVLAETLVDVAEALAPNPTATLVLTALFSALSILVLGLAVPVTASFILSWVIIGPALISLGVGAPETAMFIFYYAVLSEVSPPTALAAVASAAITGGRVVPTMLQACKYTLPAFLAPMAFVVTDNGRLLLARGDPIDVVLAAGVCGLAVVALGFLTNGWIIGRAGVERWLCLPAALLLLFLHPVAAAAGALLLAAAVAFHLYGGRHRAPSSTDLPSDPAPPNQGDHS